MLQEHIEELQEIEDRLQDEKLTAAERIVIESVRQMKEAQFYEFLGVPYDDGTNENDKLPKT